MTGFRNKQHLPHSTHSMMSDFCNLIQGKHRSNQEHYDEFNSMVNTAEASDATIGAHPGGASEILNTTASDANNPSKAETAEAVATATQRHLAVAFLLGTDKLRCGALIEEIENEFLRNKGVLSSAGTHPATAAEACDCPCDCKKNPKNPILGHNRDNFNTGATFVQESNKTNEKQEQVFTTQGGGASTNSNRPKTFAKVCQCCGSDGHNSTECNTAQDKVEIHRQSNHVTAKKTRRIQPGFSVIIVTISTPGQPSCKKATKQMKNKNRFSPRKVVVPARTATDQRHLQKCASVAAVTVTTRQSATLPKARWKFIANQISQTKASVSSSTLWTGTESTTLLAMMRLQIGCS
jgi:hypothetical protein